MAGAGVRIDVEYDDAGVRGSLRRLIDAGREIDRPGGVLDRIGARLVTSVQHRFEIERGPDGGEWQKSWRAENEGGQTLTDSGRLRASITHLLGPGEVVVGTHVRYAAIHQFGGRIVPKTAAALAFFDGDDLIIVPHVDMPARPFLGLDAGDGEVVLDEVTDELREAVTG